MKNQQTFIKDPYTKTHFATEQELATAVYDDIRKQWHE